MNPIDPIFEAIKLHRLLYAVLSSPVQKGNGVPSKITIRPVIIKKQRQVQISQFYQQKAMHSNVTAEECVELLSTSFLQQFKQALFCTDGADYHVKMGKDCALSIRKKPPTKESIEVDHNRQKEYFIKEGTPVPYLVELGVMNPSGKVSAQKYAKFRQINHFLEMVKEVVPALDRNKPLKIVDFGCGKAYLTFALYHYLHEIENFACQIEGVDTKKEVIESCQKLAQKVGYDDLRFSLCDINDFQPRDAVDMVIVLHACDVATDAALEKAVHWDARVILCVPCCQHELFKQVKNPSLEILLKHGILKERFAALATDAARAQILEILGYKTQIIEFIDMEHTPKNLLIRAVKVESRRNSKQLYEQYKIFKDTLQIKPSLEQRFDHVFMKIIKE